MKSTERSLSCKEIHKGYCISFKAMASPCEVLLETKQHSLALKLAKIAADEAWRIQDKFSRYQPESVLSQINQQNGHDVAIDDETYRLFRFADQCFKLSHGFFDITSGILRNVWYFDGGNKIPSQQKIDEILPFIGWELVKLKKFAILLQPGMELDLGGIGKEYAVDRALNLILEQAQIPTLVNFGGDLAAAGKNLQDDPWQIGIESPTLEASSKALLNLRTGALATSGDANRYLIHNGKRLSHILNPKTGWPIDNAPHSITVSAPNCIQAGFLATLGSLQGQNAEKTLQQQDIKYWSVR